MRRGKTKAVRVIMRMKVERRSKKLTEKKIVGYVCE